MLLCFGEFELSGNHSYHKGSAACTHDAGEKTDTFPTVCVGHHVPIANGKERDGDEPHGTQKVTSYILLIMVPFTDSHSPGSDDPQRDAEHQQHRARADGHERLHDESGVEVDLVEGPDASGGGISEEFAMEQHDPGDQVQAQEHGDGQNNVHVSLCPRWGIGEGQACSPEELVLSRDGVDGAHQHLQADVEDTLVGHGYPPVICTIVDHKELYFPCVIGDDQTKQDDGG